MRTDLPERPSGRVLLIDEAQRLLLFRADEASLNGGSRTIWFLPGGGAEPGESFSECAARELFEETGCRVAPADLGQIAGVRQVTFWFDGAEILSNEAYFVHTVPAWEVDTSGFTELERAAIQMHRWWTLPELQTTSEIVFPRASELATLLTQVFASGAPADPMHFSP
ncbi:MAG TPA: NUDIX domain-containing protein [Nitrolancea sp.]|nr:NUDIX domain-containing protein [Nitrolancea sp.]